MRLDSVSYAKYIFPKIHMLLFLYVGSIYKINCFWKRFEYFRSIRMRITNL